MYKSLARKLKRKSRLLGNPKLKWENNIKVDFKNDTRLWAGFIWLTMRTRDGLGHADDSIGH